MGARPRAFWVVRSTIRNGLFLVKYHQRGCVIGHYNQRPGAEGNHSASLRHERIALRPPVRSRVQTYRRVFMVQRFSVANKSEAAYMDAKDQRSIAELSAATFIGLEKQSPIPHLKAKFPVPLIARAVIARIAVRRLDDSSARILRVPAAPPCRYYWTVRTTPLGDETPPIPATTGQFPEPSAFGT